jgi:hypothetical protein
MAASDDSADVWSHEVKGLDDELAKSSIALAGGTVPPWPSTLVGIGEHTVAFVLTGEQYMSLGTRFGATMLDYKKRLRTSSFDILVIQALVRTSSAPKGLGAKLVRHICGTAKFAGYEFVAVEVEDTVESINLVQWYASLGFRHRTVWTTVTGTKMHTLVWRPL